MRSLYRILVVVVLGMFILGQFGRIELAFGRALYFQDIVIVIFLVTFFLERPLQILRQALQNRGIKLLLLFDGWIVFTSLICFHNNVSQLLTSFLYLARLNVIVFFGWALVSLLQRNILSRKQLFIGVLSAVAGIALLGLVQYAMYPDTRSLQLLGWDDHLYRLISTLFDPGFTGVVLALGAMLVLHKLLTRVGKSLPITEILLFILYSVSLLLTYSRASYLAFCGGILYLAWRKRSIAVLSILVFFAIGIVFLPRPEGEGVKLLRTASVNARVESVESAVSGSSPLQFLFGKGWYVKKLQQHTQSLRGVEVPNHSSAPENSYVFVLSSLGIVGFVLWSALLLWTLRSLQWDQRVVVSMIAVGIHAFFSNTLFHPFVVLLMVVIMAGSVRGSLEPSQPQQHS